MTQLSSFTVARIAPDASGDIQVDIRIRADMEDMGQKGYAAAHALITDELEKIAAFANAAHNVSTIGQYFERAFPTLVADFDTASSDEMWECPIDSVVGVAAMKAIDRAQSLAGMIYEGHGSFAETHHHAELVAIARVAFDLCNLYYYG